LDFESVEFLTRESVHRCGAKILEKLVEFLEVEAGSEECGCGGGFQTRKLEFKTIQTILGDLKVRRRVQRCPRCGRWRVPEDAQLDVVKTGFSPGLRRLMSRVGAEVCFDKGRDFLRELAGIGVTDKDVERVSESVGSDLSRREDAEVVPALQGHGEDMGEPVATLYITADGTGVPVLRRETAGRVGKGEDGIARSREVKLGAVFTQSRVDEKGRAVRDPESTTYVGRIEGVEAFGDRLYAEAVRRGLNRADRTVVIGDGAVWVWNLAELHFPQAIQIVDFYHAAERLGFVGQLLYPKDELRRKAWYRRMRKKLKKGKLSEIISELADFQRRRKAPGELEQAIDYFRKNENRMRYGWFRKRGLFIGSGVVEAGCKSVIGKRLKQSGMHWSVRGANAIIALRCSLESGYFADYWASRQAA
jgi:hypothetical protein